MTGQASGAAADPIGPGREGRGGDERLQLPAPPGAGSPQQGRAPPKRGPSGADRPRAGLVAFVAGLLGALLGSATTVAVVGGGEPGPPAARTPTVTDQVRTPPVEVPDHQLDRVATVAQAVLPAVVQVDIDRGGRLGLGSGNGSGVVYRSDGYIITNNHVVAAAARELDVVFSDRSRAAAQVVGRDELTDLAVLKVDRRGLTAIQVGDSSQLHVGELAVAVGSPFGLEGSVTAGIISALNRPIQVPGPGGEPLALPNVIQTDAPINPGNSGGALVGGDGRLIGINSVILTAGGPGNAGVGFAIPVNTAVSVADELIEQGFVSHPLLGVLGVSLTPGQSERVGVDSGAVVELVEPGSPAALAGLRPEDVIVALSGEPIDSMEDLVVAIRNREVGETVTITYIRGGAERTAEATLVERPRSR
ncbi:MAG TPA: trypsin-like peptidase domain-containing protein [Egibacteraceae bacterium]|nr:trypsin-like peptidase domain-containing protein [Egibacteraceae bacterium]